MPENNAAVEEVCLPAHAQHTPYPEWHRVKRALGGQWGALSLPIILIISVACKMQVKMITNAGAASGAQPSLSSSWGHLLPGLPDSEPQSLPQPGHWVRAAWATHNRQDLSPMCVWGQPGLQLSGPILPPAQGPARGTRVLLLPFGRTCYWAKLLRTCLPGQDGSDGHSGNQAISSQSVCPDVGKPSGTAGPRGTQRSDPVSARTCPPACPRGTGAALLEGSQITL